MTGRAITRWRWALAIVLTVLVTAACGGSSQGPTGEAIALDDLPGGLGRGYPQVVVAGDAPSAPQIGDAAPGFALQLEGGRHVSLASLRGQPIVINFWATWCSPCRLEMPDIVAAAQAETDVVILAVNVQEDVAAVEAFAQEFSMDLPVPLDVDGDLRTTYGISGMPTTVFIDREGAIAAIWRGLLTAETLADLVAEIR